jgi:isoamylase
VPPSPILPGRPWPLGASAETEGVNLAVASAHATAIELCLLDAEGRETRRLALPERTGDVWHGFVPGLRPGQAYGLRVHGPWDPARGHRFDPAKLLLDPYATRLTGRFAWGPAHAGGAAGRGLDTAALMPKAVIADPAELAPAPSGPGTAWAETLIYEAHVKGLTRLHPAVPERWRGAYLGLAQAPVLDHLVRLGVTAVELLPVWAFIDERRLVERGLVNYWGYNPLAFMAPEPRYALADPVAELKAAIAALHGAGLEVILDVVLNHTAESDADGPTLSLRGLDQAAYYRLGPDGRPVNHTGCGNTLDLAQPLMLRLALDALRHWAVAYGVDGFRFDLGAVLGRDRTDHFDPDAPFLQALRQDPVLAGKKLIAEPWDLGPDGYRLGGFPQPMAEWNDRFRDCVRRFWKGDEGMAPELAARLLGSADIFEGSRRPPQASINLLTSHDGFTLADLGAYARRHNEANGEANRDGHAESHGLNHGVEGPSEDPAVEAARARHRRNLLATLLLAQGTPMLLMGDELRRSQGGNNNAYCQDNPTSWCAWDRVDRDLLAFVRKLAGLRRAHPALRRRRFLHGRHRDAAGRSDVTWLAEDGRTKTPGHWQEPGRRRLALLLAGAAAPDLDRDGRPLHDATLLLLLNAAAEPAAFTLPALGDGNGWRALLDTAAARDDAVLRGSVTVAARSLLLLAAEA